MSYSDSQWDAFGLSTSSVDQAKATELVGKIYEFAGYPEPQIVFCQSPLGVVLEASKITAAYMKAVRALKGTVQISVDYGNGPVDFEYATLERYYSSSDIWYSLDLLWGGDVVRTNHWSRRSYDWKSIDLYNFLRGWILDFRAWKREHPAGYEVINEHHLTGWWGWTRGRIFSWKNFGLSPYCMLGSDGTFTEDQVELASMVFSAHLFPKIAFICERPEEIHMSEEGWFSRNPMEGPAVKWRDGAGTYAFRGVMVPRITGRLTTKKIDKILNTEVRRVLIDTYGGTAKYLEDSGAELVHADGFGELWKRPKAFDAPDEELVFVKVVNSTPEPDGTYKDYFLRVPPRMQTAEAAVAWTFGMQAGAYAPAVQT